MWITTVYDKKKKFTISSDEIKHFILFLLRRVYCEVRHIIGKFKVKTDIIGPFRNTYKTK